MNKSKTNLHETGQIMDEIKMKNWNSAFLGQIQKLSSEVAALCDVHSVQGSILCRQMLLRSLQEDSAPIYTETNTIIIRKRY